MGEYSLPNSLGNVDEGLLESGLRVLERGLGLSLPGFPFRDGDPMTTSAEFRTHNTCSFSAQILSARARLYEQGRRSLGGEERKRAAATVPVSRVTERAFLEEKG